MASICKEIGIDAPCETVWEALRDVGALHTRLVPGFVVHTELDGGSRLVTFGDGRVVREHIVDVCDEDRRVAWAIVDAPFLHYNGAARVVATSPSTCRFIWTADLLPDELHDPVAGMIETGLGVIKRTMESDRT